MYEYCLSLKYCDLWKSKGENVNNMQLFMKGNCRKLSRNVQHTGCAMRPEQQVHHSTSNITTSPSHVGSQESIDPKDKGKFPEKYHKTAFVHEEVNIWDACISSNSVLKSIMIDMLRYSPFHKSASVALSLKYNVAASTYINVNIPSCKKAKRQNNEWQIQTNAVQHKLLLV
jgi:hypothetical protein